MALKGFGKCFKLEVSKEVMPYNIYIYENANMGAASVQSALHILSDSGKQPFLFNLVNGIVILGKGMNDEMFDLIKYSSICCKMDCKVLTGGYCVLRSWMLEHIELDVDSYITTQPLASSLVFKSGCYENVFQTSGV